MRIGGHLPTRDPLGTADRLGIDVIQIHVSSPRTWKAPRPRPDADELAASGRLVAVHAPYLCNPASSDPLVRERTEVMLQQTLDAAADLEAGCVVVHAGQAGAGGRVEDAIVRWERLLPRLHGTVPLLIENTASGMASVGRHVDSIAALFEALRACEADVRVGACLDTAHAFAAGPAAEKDPGGWVERFAEATGGVDLVHVNDSAAPAGSGRDRHANLGAGLMGLRAIAAMLAASGAPAAVLETPGCDERR
ncbi:MAG TPA: TIM barrel protein, partial [Euzebyales bacterium]|nr:TIM barrel protein [Euzebyales bacterium]